MKSINGSIENVQKLLLDQRFSQLSIGNHINKFIIVYLSIAIKISTLDKEVNLSHVGSTTVFGEPGGKLIAVDLT